MHFSQSSAALLLYVKCEFFSCLIHYFFYGWVVCCMFSVVTETCSAPVGVIKGWKFEIKVKVTNALSGLYTERTDGQSLLRLITFESGHFLLQDLIVVSATRLDAEYFEPQSFYAIC